MTIKELGLRIRGVAFAVLANGEISDAVMAEIESIEAEIAGVRKRAFQECAKIADEGREWAEGDCRAVRDRIKYLADKPEGYKYDEDAE